MASTWNVNREYDGIEISFDGKPSEEIRNKMKAVGFKWSSAQMKWYAKDNSRTRQVANELATQEEDVGEHLTFEQKMERDKERAEHRQERLGAKAENLEKKSDDLLDKAHKMASVIPFGQPILVGHHSEGRDRRYRGRIHDTFEKGFGTRDEAKEVSQRLEGSQALSRKRETPGYMSRKIDKLEADLRKFERDKGQWQGQLAEWEKRTNTLKEQITYWKKELGEAGGLKVTPADVKAGDEILYLSTWYEVVRVNPKTVTIKNWLDIPTWTWGAEYSKIKAVRQKETKVQPYVSTVPDKVVSIVERSNVQVMPAEELQETQFFKDQLSYLLHTLDKGYQQRVDEFVTGFNKEFLPSNKVITKHVVEQAISNERRVTLTPELSRYPDPTKSTTPKVFTYFFRNRPPDIGTFPKGAVMKEAWIPKRATEKGNMAWGWASYERELTPDELYNYELFVDEIVMPKLVKELIKFTHEPKLEDQEKAKLFLSALSRFTLDELKQQEATVKRWSIKFPQMEKELEDEYKMYLELRQAEKATAEAARKEKYSKPRSEHAQDLHKQMRKINSVQELDTWRDRILFESHLPDVQEDILMRDLAAKWRVYLETRGIPALEKLDKLGTDLIDDFYYFGTEVTVHPTTTIIDDMPWKGILHDARNGGELWEVTRVGHEDEGTKRVQIGRVYVTKLVEKPEPRYQVPIKKEYVFTRDHQGNIIIEDSINPANYSFKIPTLISQYATKLLSKQEEKDWIEYRRVIITDPKRFEGITIDNVIQNKTSEKPKLTPDTSSKDYKSGYNLAIQGRIAPAVPSWQDQGQADFAQGYKDGQVAKTRKENEELLAKDKAERDKILYTEQAEEQELDLELNRLSPQYKSFIEKEITGILHMSKDDRNYHNRFVIALGKARRIILEIQQNFKKEAQSKEVPVFGLPQDTKKFIEEFGKPVQAIPEKPRVLGAPSRQQQTERALHERAADGKKLRRQQTLTSAVSTSQRLSAFEEKPKIPERITSLPFKRPIPFFIPGRVPYKKINVPPRQLYGMPEEQMNIDEEREAKELADKTIAEITMQRIKKQIEKAKQRFG